MWYLSLIPTLRRWRRWISEFDASLDYKESSRTAGLHIPRGSRAHFYHGIKHIICWVDSSHFNSFWKLLPLCVGTLVSTLRGAVLEWYGIDYRSEGALCCHHWLPDNSLKRPFWADRPAASGGCPGGSHQNCLRDLPGYRYLCLLQIRGQNWQLWLRPVLSLLFLWGVCVWSPHLLVHAGLYDAAISSVFVLVEVKYRTILRAFRSGDWSR